MNYLLVLKFLSIILCLTLGAGIIKKYLVCFPEELIPALNTVFGIIFNCVWLTFADIEAMGNVVIDGMLLGWASVGLHQLFKQTKRYIKIRKYFHKLDIERRSDHE